MSNDIIDEPAPISNLPRLRYSLLAVLLFVAAISLFLGYVFRTRYCRATVLFRVSAQPSGVWEGGPAHFDAREFELFKNTQISLIKSNFVLQSALRDPAIASLPIFAGKSDLVAWLAENIEADFPDAGEVLAIWLRGNRVFDSDIQRVVDAVAKAYEKEVVFADRTRQSLVRDSLAKSLSEVEQNLKQQLSEYYEMKKELGSAESVDLELRKQQIDLLREVATELSRRLEIRDIIAEAPAELQRIQKIQPALITNE